ncbi:MAG: zeta toxin family protein [Rikenellaceae bacterium]|nr:zeta toxin family protein [Rikenellaceae bacterium]
MAFMYIIAGCNGAGKTTASYTVLPEMLGCREFVNADEIARGLSPFRPDRVAIEAGRLMLKRIDELIESGEDFAFETTLATRIYARLIKKARAHGYVVNILYFWLSSADLAVSRVETRVEEGGHDIPEPVVRRRYEAGIRNFFRIYRPLCDYWLIIDNTGPGRRIIADGCRRETKSVADTLVYGKLEKYERD